MTTFSFPAPLWGRRVSFLFLSGLFLTGLVLAGCGGAQEESGVESDANVVPDEEVERQGFRKGESN